MANQPRYNPRQAWVSLTALFVLAALFGFVVLPYAKPGSGALVGKEAPDFVLPVIHGGEQGSRLKLSQLRGNAVVLDFWASWCEPCRRQVPIFERVHASYKGHPVRFVGVNTMDERRAATAFCKEAGLGYPAVFDETAEVGKAYGVSSLPTLVVVDKQGVVSSVVARPVSEAELSRLLEAVL